MGTDLGQHLGPGLLVASGALRRDLNLPVPDFHGLRRRGRQWLRNLLRAGPWVPQPACIPPSDQPTTLNPTTSHLPIPQIKPQAAADHAWRRLLGRTDRRWHLPFPPPAPLDVILYRTACPPIFAAAAILGPGSGAVLDQAPRAGLATSSQAGRQRVDLAQAAASPEQGAADPPSEVALLLPPPSPTASEQSPALASPGGGGSEGQSPPTPAAATAAGAPASEPGTNQTLYIALGAGIGGALVLGTGEWGGVKGWAFGRVAPSHACVPPGGTRPWIAPLLYVVTSLRPRPSQL